MEKKAVGQIVTRNKFRFLILVMGTLCLSIVFSNVISVNFTINCMDPVKNNHSQSEVGSHKVKFYSLFFFQLKYSLHAYTSREKTYIQWAVSLSSMLATFPFSYICTRWGAQYIFLFSGLGSAFSTIFIPWTIDFGLGWFLLMRVLQGKNKFN